MSQHYHNTTDSHGAELARYERAAESQDERIVAIFRKHAPFGLTPSQVHRALATGAPITSIRRAISNLTDCGVLDKTREQVKGPYGRPEYRWKVRLEPRQERLL
jgi:hypothetical protein